MSGLNRSHAAVQEKLNNMTNLTFERAVEIAVNMMMVKEHARQFHSPGGVSVGASSSMNVNRATGMQVQIRKMFLMWQDRTYSESKVCKGTSRVRSVIEESPYEQDDHFIVYSTHIGDALKSSALECLCA